MTFPSSGLTVAQAAALAVLTSDVQAALSGASSPSAGNVFATASTAGMTAAQAAKVLGLPTFTPPLAANFTLTSGGGTTMTATDVAAADGRRAHLRVVKPQEASLLWGRLEMDRGTTTRIEMCGRFVGNLVNFATFGVYLRNVVDDKRGISAFGGNNDASALFAEAYTNTADNGGASDFTGTVKLRHVGVGQFVRCRLDFAAGAMTALTYVGDGFPTDAEFIQTGTKATGYFTGDAATKMGMAFLAPNANPDGVWEIHDWKVS